MTFPLPSPSVQQDAVGSLSVQREGKPHIVAAQGMIEEEDLR